MVMGTENLLSGSVNGQTSYHGIILLKGHIIGGIFNACCIKYILVVEHNPEVIAEGKFI